MSPGNVLAIIPADLLGALYQLSWKKTFCDNWIGFHWHLSAIQQCERFFSGTGSPGCPGLTGYCCATIEPLQRVQNVAAHLVLNLHLCDNITPALKQLH